MLAILGGCAADPAPASTTRTPSAASTTATPTSPPSKSRGTSAATPAARERPSGDPDRVVVTTPGGKELVDAELVSARLDDDGILAPSPGVVGWYAEAGWPKPGFPGTAILAGHINTRKNGPDTFARLPQVRPGATVTVRYSSGDKVNFVVTRSKAVPKRQTPKDDTIWDANNPRPLLRLITCDPTTPVKGGHYVGNWVVWASPAR